MAARWVAALLLVVAVLGSIAHAVEITTSKGRLRGRETSDGALIFEGIPYARPPVGPLRWKSPVEEEPWEGVRDATALGAPCHPLALEGGMLGEAGTPNEDCLFLNVYVPAEARKADERLPVMVMLHGGGFMLGSSGHEMVSPNPMRFINNTHVIYVSINYRLGPLGFLAHPALDEPGANSGAFGIQDQIAALRWVQREIGHFYGDASRVTVMGESAGAFSICLLMASPASRGLFQRAYLASALCNYPFQSRNEGHAQGEVLAERVGCAGKATLEETRACLYALSPEALRTAIKMRRGMIFYEGAVWFPVIDETTIAAAPLEYFAQNGGAVDRSTRVVFGHNEDEGTVFIFLAFPMYIEERLIHDLIGGTYGAEPLAAIVDYNREARATLTDRQYAGALLSQMWQCASRSSARALSAALEPGNLYFYHYSHYVQGVPWPFDALGSSHGSELAMWSGNQAKPEFPANVAISRKMQAAMRALAHDGAPVAVDGDAPWRPFTAADEYVHPFWTETSCNRTACGQPIVPSFAACAVWDALADDKGRLIMPRNADEPLHSRVLNETVPRILRSMGLRNFMLALFTVFFVTYQAIAALRRKSTAKPKTA